MWYTTGASNTLLQCQLVFYNLDFQFVCYDDAYIRAGLDTGKFHTQHFIQKLKQCWSWKLNLLELCVHGEISEMVIYAWGIWPQWPKISLQFLSLSVSYHAHSEDLFLHHKVNNPLFLKAACIITAIDGVANTCLCVFHCKYCFAWFIDIRTLALFWLTCLVAGTE